VHRVDGTEKVTGTAKYTFDIVLPNMLYGKILRSPYASAKIVSIDTSKAEKMEGFMLSSPPKILSIKNRVFGAVSPNYAMKKSFAAKESAISATL